MFATLRQFAPVKDERIDIKVFPSLLKPYFHTIAVVLFIPFSGPKFSNNNHNRHNIEANDTAWLRDVLSRLDSVPA
jgi:hypothetical protein